MCVCVCVCVQYNFIFGERGGGNFKIMVQDIKILQLYPSKQCTWYMYIIAKGLVLFLSSLCVIISVCVKSLCKLN